MRDISDVHLSEGTDEISWDLEPSGRFSVKSLYAKLSRGPSIAHTKLLWRAAIPLQIKVFLWQALRNRLPTASNIHRRQGPSDGNCALCGASEDVNHIIFSYTVAKF